MLSLSPLVAMVAHRRLVRALLVPVTALLALSLAVAPASAMAKKSKKYTTTVRVHAEANALDGEQFSAAVRIPYPPYNLHISKIPIFSELQVTGFRSYPQPDGTYGVLLQLNESGRIAIETVSLEKPRTYLVILINGHQVDPIFIDRPVRGKTFYIKGGLTVKDLELFSENFEMAVPAEELARIATARGEAVEGERISRESRAARGTRKKQAKPKDEAPAESSLFLDGPDSDAMPVLPAR